MPDQVIDEARARESEEPTCYLQQAVGEPAGWQSGAGKSAAKLRDGAKHQMQTVKHNISKDRELMRRVSDGDAPKRSDKIKPNLEDYIKEFGLKMDIEG